MSQIAPGRGMVARSGRRPHADRRGRRLVSRWLADQTPRGDRAFAGLLNREEYGGYWLWSLTRSCRSRWRMPASSPPMSVRRKAIWPSGSTPTNWWSRAPTTASAHRAIPTARAVPACPPRLRGAGSTARPEQLARIALERGDDWTVTSGGKSAQARRMSAIFDRLTRLFEDGHTRDLDDLLTDSRFADADRTADAAVLIADR